MDIKNIKCKMFVLNIMKSSSDIMKIEVMEVKSNRSIDPAKTEVPIQKQSYDERP